MPPTGARARGFAALLVCGVDHDELAPVWRALLRNLSRRDLMALAATGRAAAHIVGALWRGDAELRRAVLARTVAQHGRVLHCCRCCCSAPAFPACKGGRCAACCDAPGCDHGVYQCVTCKALVLSRHARFKSVVHWRPQQAGRSYRSGAGLGYQPLLCWCVDHITPATALHRRI